ncbi:MAG: dephospho-CoA kinase [Lachnospiraceae bacterium]|nr:dephospho-CoA kinase [Lachnospiraceae bacterium]
MKVIGITGGVGSGKSALLHAISEEYNCRILLADDIANFLKEPGQRCYEPLVYLLGHGVLDEEGYFDRQKMADLIFGNEALLELVNLVVHPAVKQYIREVIEGERQKGQVEFCFVEAALFIEAGYRDMVDSLWYIFATEEVRVQRLLEGRGYSLEKIHSIMKNQLQEEVFRAKCDVVIDNSSTLEEAMAQVRPELKNK